MGEKKKIQIGQEAFEVFLSNNFENTALIDYIKNKKLEIRIVELKELIRQYRYRHLPPKPTNEEAIKYDEWVSNKNLLLGHEKEYNEAIINDIKANNQYAVQLTGLVESGKYSLEEIFTNLDGFIATLNDRKEIELYKRIITCYKRYQKKLNDPETFSKAPDNALYITYQIVKEVLSSPSLTIKDSLNSHQDKITIEEFFANLSKIKKGTEADKELIRNIERRWTEEIIKTILKAKSELENFTIEDYYQITKIEPKTILEQAKELEKKKIITTRQLYDLSNLLTRGNKNKHSPSPRRSVA